MLVGCTYPAFNYDIASSFKKALGSSVEVKLMLTYEDLEQSDLIAFPGGEDVNPNLYSQGNTHSHGINTKRDERETYIYRHAKSLNKPMFGMCRGLQFLAVMLGQELIQDIYLELEQKHSGGHSLDIPIESIISSNFTTVNSLHHQGVFSSTDTRYLHQLVNSGIYVTSTYKNIVESFESNKIIATQFHPEFLYNEESNNFFTALGQWVENPKFTFDSERYLQQIRVLPKKKLVREFREDADRINSIPTDSIVWVSGEPVIRPPEYRGGRSYYNIPVEGVLENNAITEQELTELLMENSEDEDEN